MSDNSLLHEVSQSSYKDAINKMAKKIDDIGSSTSELKEREATLYYEYVDTLTTLSIHFTVDSPVIGVTFTGLTIADVDYDSATISSGLFVGITNAYDNENDNYDCYVHIQFISVEGFNTALTVNGNFTITLKYYYL